MDKVPPRVHVPAAAAAAKENPVISVAILESIILFIKINANAMPHGAADGSVYPRRTRCALRSGGDLAKSVRRRRAYIQLADCLPARRGPICAKLRSIARRMSAHRRSDSDASCDTANDEKHRRAKCACERVPMISTMSPWWYDMTRRDTDRDAKRDARVNASANSRVRHDDARCVRLPGHDHTSRTKRTLRHITRRAHDRHIRLSSAPQPKATCLFGTRHIRKRNRRTPSGVPHRQTTGARPRRVTHAANEWALL